MVISFLLPIKYGLLVLYFLLRMKEGIFLNIIIAPDSFKGTLTAKEAAEAINEGIKEFHSNIHTILLPVADGGEGTMESLVSATKGKFVLCKVHDPLGRQIEARYGVLGDKKTCVIEVAEASGLMRLEKNERNPFIASTYGTGELIRYALDEGFRKFIIGLGGSATNDAGTGMLRALGMKFFDKSNNELKDGGGFLYELVDIDMSHFDQRIKQSEFIIASDVNNPLVGENGASRVFGPQKGATGDMIQHLDRGLTKFADIVEEKTGISLHHQRGAGAAGGIGGAFIAFFPAEMKEGIQVVLEAISFQQYVEKADLIIVGEGKTDEQTLSGKAPFGIAKVAKKYNKPVILISGIIDTNINNMRKLFTEVHSVVGESISEEEAIRNAYQSLKVKAKEVMEKYIQN